MKDIVTKLCCCAMFAACCIDGAEGIPREQAESQDLHVRCLPAQRRMAERAINSINAAAVNIERLAQPFLDGNLDGNQQDIVIRGELSFLRSLARNLTRAYIPNLSRELNIRVSDVAQNTANGGATVRESLGSFRNYVNNIQAGVNNLNGMLPNLSQSVRNNIEGMQQGVELMNDMLESLQQSTTPTPAQP